jgi:CheY-like chemotaxis protein
LLHFSVADTGIGIPGDKQGQLFAPFAQVDSALTRRHGGTGLGLAISKRLAEMMDGDVWLESPAPNAVGSGSSSLPTAHCPLPTALERPGCVFHFRARFGLQQEPLPRAVPVEAGRLRGLPVLVVDDNATNRRILEQTLRAWQLEPLAVDSGALALDTLLRAARAGQPFALALVDGNMPGMDGFALTERIRAEPELAGLVVLMLTSGGQPGEIARCRRLGVTSYLTKPVKQNELWKTITAALGTSDAVGSGQWAVGREEQPLPTAHRPLPTASRPLRILLAEDSPINQRLALALLEKRGHAVTVVGNGAAALQALERRSFDLVLMDLQMPEMDGLEATAQLRRKERDGGGHVPIIAMTAYAMQGDRERCLEVGMDGYVSKPIRAAELYRVIEGLEQARSPEGTAPAPSSAAVDWAAALDYFGGDRKLLRDLIRIFLEEYPRWLTELRQAIDAGSVAEVRRLAHSLKGSLAHFGAQNGCEAAYQLEMMGRSGILDGAADACAALASELERLRPALAACPEAVGAEG